MVMVTVSQNIWVKYGGSDRMTVQMLNKANILKANSGTADSNNVFLTWSL